MTFSYCLGVLHHLKDPDAGMRSIARVTDGPLLVYLYYALDNRPRIHRVLLALVTGVRRVTSRLPPLNVFVTCLPRPSPSLGLMKTRASQTPGLRWRTVATCWRTADKMKQLTGSSNRAATCRSISCDQFPKRMTS